ncbi:MAG: hydantoinase/oxoprolinase family protein [Candidatus Aminicenantes bacterium]
MTRFKVGVDIGGTFTDGLLMDQQEGKTFTTKVATSTPDVSLGFLQAWEELLNKAQKSPEEMSVLIHATTAATNAILEGKTAKTALITTKGFGDILEIARQKRPQPYDFFTEKIPPLIPSCLRKEVSERTDASGNILTPVNEKELDPVLKKLVKQEKVSALAVCFLFSYLNPASEYKVKETISRYYPEVMVCLSSEVLPEIREYERTSATVINACLRPLVDQYLSKVEKAVQEKGSANSLRIMGSNGGMMTPVMARELPAKMVESGPAAGVTASAHLARLLNLKNAISFDMGGTTAKASLIQDGQSPFTSEQEIGGSLYGHNVKKGGGYPLRLPSLDLAEVGAGAGSTAWIDSGGALNVGPQSAGVNPGPVCYGQGGKSPTVTDANLVLGRLNPKYFLEGRMPLDARAARTAIQSKIAEPLGLSIFQAAQGIIQIANANMLRALRFISLERGQDPRQFTLIAFGGSGGAHGADLAEELQIPKVIVPVEPGLFSCYGLLASDLRVDVSLARMMPLSSRKTEEIENLFGGLEKKARQQLKKQVPSKKGQVKRSADIRYQGQTHWLNISFPSRPLKQNHLQKVANRFHTEHHHFYGHSHPHHPLQLVNLRVTIIVKSPDIALPHYHPKANQSVFKGKRKVFFKQSQGLVETPIYERTNLCPARVTEIEGPAVIEEPNSTTVIPPGWKARRDSHENLMLTRH